MNIFFFFLKVFRYGRGPSQAHRRQSVYAMSNKLVPSPPAKNGCPFPFLARYVATFLSAVSSHSSKLLVRFFSFLSSLPCPPFSSPSRACHRAEATSPFRQTFFLSKVCLPTSARKSRRLFPMRAFFCFPFYHPLTLAEFRLAMLSTLW